MTKTVRLNILLVVIIIVNLLALNFLSTFCTRMGHYHSRGVHHLEFTCKFNYEVPDDFRWVSFVNSIVFLCMYV